MKAVNEFTQEMLNDYGVVFPQALIDRVKRDFLFELYSEVFEGLSDQMQCMQFVYLSNAKNSQRGLANEIAQVVVDKMLLNK